MTMNPWDTTGPSIWTKDKRTKSEVSADAAGCPQAVFHSLRHSTASKVPSAPLSFEQITEMWVAAVDKANPTAGNAPHIFARAIERRVRGET